MDGECHDRSQPHSNNFFQFEFQVATDSNDNDGNYDQDDEY